MLSFVHFFLNLIKLQKYFLVHTVEISINYVHIITCRTDKTPWTPLWDVPRSHLRFLSVAARYTFQPNTCERIQILQPLIALGIISLYNNICNSCQNISLCLGVENTEHVKICVWIWPGYRIAPSRSRAVDHLWSDQLKPIITLKRNCCPGRIPAIS